MVNGVSFVRASCRLSSKELAGRLGVFGKRVSSQFNLAQPRPFAREQCRHYFGGGGGGRRKAATTSSPSTPSNTTNTATSIQKAAEAPKNMGLNDPSAGSGGLAATTDMTSPSSTLASTEASQEVTEGWNQNQTFNDTPLDEGVENGENWTRSFKGLGSEPFPERTTEILLNEIKPEEVEITPDGLLYLPEIRYRRILNRAFGPGGWGLAPRSQTLVTDKSVSREYALICHGRLVGIARGEQDYFDRNGITTAMEGCKSNAMMRCCKDLGIASELWDPVFIRSFKAKYCETKYFEKKRRMVWKRKDREWEYPYNK